MFRVATWTNTIRPNATIQLTIIELVIGKPKRRVISTALCVRPCSSCSGAAGDKPPGSGTLWLATALADVTEATSAGARAANVKSALRPTNETKNTSAHLVFSLRRIPASYAARVGASPRLNISIIGMFTREFESTTSSSTFTNTVLGVTIAPEF